MYRDKKLYIEDILDSANAIKIFVKDLDFESFKNDRREFAVIGEAVSKIIDDLQEKFPNYPWRMIKDFRNFIIHEYFGVDPRIVWDIIELELDDLVKNISLIYQKG